MENIILQDVRKEQIKIIDFGLSNHYNNGDHLKTQCGSPEYAAPELFIKGKKYGPEIDLWSLGVILFVLCSGRLPFTVPRDCQISNEERRRKLMSQINRGLGTPQKLIIATLTAEYKNLVHRLLTPAADRRIHVEEIHRHPWMIEQQSSLISTEIVKIEEINRLENVDHERIMEGLAKHSRLNRQMLEIDITDRRFGEIGGMYNIMTHKVLCSKNNIKERNLAKSGLVRRNINKTLPSTNNLKNKVIKHFTKMKSHNQNQLSSKVKSNANSSDINQMSCKPKERIRLFLIRNRISKKEAEVQTPDIPIRAGQKVEEENSAKLIYRSNKTNMKIKPRKIAQEHLKQNLKPNEKVLQQDKSNKLLRSTLTVKHPSSRKSCHKSEIKNSMKELERETQSVTVVSKDQHCVVETQTNFNLKNAEKVNVRKRKISASNRIKSPEKCKADQTSVSESKDKTKPTYRYHLRKLALKKT